jgi:hypothetical protein
VIARLGEIAGNSVIASTPTEGSARLMVMKTSSFQSL